ncbi:MAG: hypothetical protein HXX13_17950 [Bacteroidetes bacterium]|nr:hypothetical protein [Bacteroidota bacterium]
MKPTILTIPTIENLPPKLLSRFSGKINYLSVLIFLLCFLQASKTNAQIWEPEGLNMPGAWNTWVNPPSNKLALASSTQVTNGRVVKIATGTTRWQTIFSVAASGGDLTGGAYGFVFSSGSSSNPWGNTWKNVTVAMNTLQTYTYNGSSDNQITITNGKWYTMNWKDNGYASTQAIFMETSAQPVNITSVTVPALATIGSPIVVNALTSANLSTEEILYLRYSTDSWATSTAISFSMSGISGTATIPAQSSAGVVSCYVFSSTINGIATDFDMKSIRINNNSGTNYSIPVGGSLPTVSTGAITAIGGNTATAAGTVLADGGSAVTARGFYWGTAANPGPGDNISTAGTGSGAFTSVLNSLTPGTTYHIRAYATNSSGTGYGSDAQFTCLSAVTFLLDMTTASGYNSASDLVYLSGSFTGMSWIEPGMNTALQMSSSGYGNLSLVLYLANGTYEFKHFKNSGWAGGEWTAGTNRSISVNGNTTVNSIWGGEISYANLQWPAIGSIVAGDAFNVYGHVTIPNGRTGVAGGAYGIHAWIGYSTVASDPTTWTNWVPAVYNLVSGTSDEYMANLGAVITSAGTYYYASRFQAGAGPLFYGGYNGGFWNGTTNVSGTLTVTPATTTRSLTVTAFIEGLYTGGATMRKAQNAAGDQFTGTVADKVTVELHSQSSYATVVYSDTAAVLNVDGTIVLSNIPATFNSSYFVTIRHRNSITTTSATVVSLATSPAIYDFTSAASKAFGSNLKNIAGKYCIYSGDVNQDGFVNAADKTLTESSVHAFSEGYLLTDLNGDGLADTSDEIIIDNNMRAGTAAILP